MNYPSTITFWVRVLGVALHYLTVHTIESICDAFGEVEQVVLDEGRILVVNDGL